MRPLFGDSARRMADTCAHVSIIYPPTHPLPSLDPGRQRLTIGLVGFGTFGQFLAARFVAQGNTVLATSRRDYSQAAEALGVRYMRDADDFCEAHPDVVVLCTSILSTETVLSALPLYRLRRSTLIVDVLSVKTFPKRLLLEACPDNFDILCTHPMFGPDSGKNGWGGLTFMYDEVRTNDGPGRRERVGAFLNCFKREGCDMKSMTCEEHDRFAASSQFITHTVGRMLGKLSLESTPVDTRGYQTLLDLVDNTANDSFELYYGLFMYNGNATEELDRLEKAFDGLKKQLFEELHDKLREQLYLDPRDPQHLANASTTTQISDSDSESGAEGGAVGGAANGDAAAEAARRAAAQANER